MRTPSGAPPRREVPTEELQRSTAFVSPSDLWSPPPRAVVLDYGLTLATWQNPRPALLRAMEEVRPWLGDDPPSAATIVDGILGPIDAELPALASLAEVDYLAHFARGWRRAGFELPAPTLYAILDREQGCWDAAARLAPDALTTLDGLRSRGIRTALCSNAPFPPEMVRRQLATVGVAQRMDAIALSSEIGRRKPARQLYEAALAALDVAPEDALFVGDQPGEDVEGPRRIGMRAVLCQGLSRAAAPPGIPAIARLGELLERIA
ncbi:MAG: HAD-IA family hydrolase [Candidatus Dormiibacterota bacterium]